MSGPRRRASPLTRSYFGRWLRFFHADNRCSHARVRRAPYFHRGAPRAGRGWKVLTETGGQWQARIRAGVEPGAVRVRVDVPGAPVATAGLTLQLNAADSFEDGTPDFLRLDDDADRRAFRRWFTYLAEARYFEAAEERPAEVDDCAALIRYAYREALRAHDGAWASAAGLTVVPAFESVLKYRYPHTRAWRGAVSRAERPLPGRRPGGWRIRGVRRCPHPVAMEHAPPGPEPGQREAGATCCSSAANPTLITA